MNKNIVLATLLAILSGLYGDTVSAASPEASAARILNVQAKRSLGVDIRALAFLFEANQRTFLRKESLVSDGSWSHLASLEKAGYVTATTIKSRDGDYISLSLTTKGQQVLLALGP